MYFISIILFVLLIASFNAVLSILKISSEAWFFYYIWSFLVTVFVIAIDGIFATVVRWLLPEKMFAIDKKSFVGKKKECFFYEKIGIKSWKDKVLELGSVTSFRKNKISDPKNNEWVSRYILEANYGVAVHLCGMLFGFLAMFCCPKSFRLCVGLPICVVNLFYNFLSFAILRYNLPKLHVLYKYNKKRDLLQQNKNEVIV